MSSFKHQGDVTFVKIKNFNSEDSIKHNGKFVLAYGETTGHRHVITVDDPKDMQIFREKNGLYFLNILSPATITHEEHQSIVLTPGKYRVGKEREMDHFADIQRQVID